METLALMGLSVVLSVIVGVILGIMCSLSDRFERGMKPVLDTMQVMPAFVYLIPAMFFFGIEAPAFTTMIYSMPPIIRLTNLGIVRYLMKLLRQQLHLVLQERKHYLRFKYH